ncbi:hypothetical protein E1301_Tti019344 [Triplophysa tibetana]|uniref:Uncharacterized protein n=1 Tax=Triplophysa tibetana TaxID=1572043 RepID=A0A5A9PI18_9TELE|nr:hypothetical protein E1301_Tti019344 [Triplophysa tibetana]
MNKTNKQSSSNDRRAFVQFSKSVCKYKTSIKWKFGSNGTFKRTKPYVDITAVQKADSVKMKDDFKELVGGHSN